MLDKMCRKKCCRQCPRRFITYKVLHRNAEHEKIYRYFSYTSLSHVKSVHTIYYFGQMKFVIIVSINYRNILFKFKEKHK